MKERLAAAAGLAGLFVLIFAGEQTLSLCREALRLCLEQIIPALFPFFVVSAYLSGIGLPGLLASRLQRPAERLFGVSGRGFSAFFTGILGGYPTGAAAIAAMEERGEISPAEARRLLVFCNNSGPAFIIGAAGWGVFGSAGAGLILYIIHILSALICGLLLSGGERLPPAAARSPGLSPAAALAYGLRSSVINILTVCGCITVFSVFAGLLEELGLMGAAAELLGGLLGWREEFSLCLLRGLIELSSGISSLAALPVSRESFALAAFLLGFGGLSVQLQTAALFADSDIKSAPLLGGRLVSAALAAVFAYEAGGLFL